MQRRYVLIVGLPILVLFCIIFSQLVAIVSVHAINTKYWDDTNNNNCDLAQQYCGSQNIKSAVGETQYVHKSGVSVRAYFHSQGSGTITIYGANYCPGQSNNPDNLETEDYYGSHSIGQNGTPATYFALYSFGDQAYGIDYQYGRYYSGDDARCNDPVILHVITQQDTSITGQPIYYADIFVSSMITSPSGYPGVQNYFDMAITGGDKYAIAQLKTQPSQVGYSGTMQKVGGSGNYTDYIVKFGSDCTITKDTPNQKLYSYDLDAAGGSGAQVGPPIKMELWEQLPNQDWKQLWKDVTPPKIDNQATPIDFTAKPGARYEWHINGVYKNNTLQVSAPFDSIFYKNTVDDPLCLNKSYTYPNTTLDDGTISINGTRGTSHNFKHYVDVNPYAPGHNGTVNWRVQTKTNNGGWADSGRTGTETIDRQQIDNAAALVNTGPYVVPSTGSGRYCERLVLSNPQTSDNVGIRYTTSQELCIDYDNSVIPGNLPIKTVEFRTQGGGAEVKDEPEKTEDVNGGSLSGTLGVKPATNELGYENQAKQIEAQPVVEAEHPIGTGTDGQRTVDDSYAATCIPRTHPDGNGNWVPDVPTVCVVYDCPNGGGLSGTTCVKSHEEWHYYCIVPGMGYVDRGWHSSDPSCGYSNYDSCPDGTPARTGPSNGKRACNDAWTCAYGQLWTNVGKPYCEFRCDLGVGSKALLAETKPMTNNKGTTFETWGNGDTNCYKPWQVSIICQITYTSTGGTWVPSSGRRVVNGTVQTWTETITTDAYGNMANYCTNPPGGYWATQYEYGDIGTQGCIALSLATVSVFTDTSPSPLSPNNRVVKTAFWNRAIVGGPATKCWTSIGRPYAQFNNTDISTMTCGSGAGDVNLYAYDDYGSSVEYAAFAAGTINALRTNYNNGSQGLAFASDGGKSATGGGYFGGKSNSNCNYYASLVNSHGSFVQSRIKVYDSDVTIDQNFIRNNLTSSAYTPGSYAIFAPNITVSGNISLPFTLSNDASNLNNTGAVILYLIAKNSVSINSGVTNVDAMLISDNTINTCNGSAPACENNLTINGGLAAANIQFRRTGLSSLNCSRPGRGDVCAKYDRPAETINYGAYYEIFTAPFQPVSGIDQGKYDSIKSVAPIF